MRYIAGQFPELVGTVTADADGQHTPEDISRIRRKLSENPGSIVLGARAFRGKVPSRSLVGNLVTRVAFRVATGLRLADTQTGLRGIPSDAYQKILTIPFSGYEFETEMILVCKRERIPILQIAIETVYIDDNSSSHFRPLVNSMRIYFVLFRYSLASLAAAVVDYTIFAIVGRFTSLVR